MAVKRTVSELGYRTGRRTDCSFAYVVAGYKTDKASVEQAICHLQVQGPAIQQRVFRNV